MSSPSPRVLQERPLANDPGAGNGRLDGVGTEELELSVVLPCLDESDTLERVILKAFAAMERDGIRGEVVVADNGSTDGSREIALASGARLVEVSERGYGCALAGGFRAAKGRFVMMADADDSYDLTELGAFVRELRAGSTVVQGCRLPSGGGKVLPGAMPVLHRYLGNPALSFLARTWLGVRVHDIYCGMRAFRRELIEQLDLRATGMEYATEMIIQCARQGVHVSQVPITLHRDGRVSHPPHLRTVRDGWRTLRLFLSSGPAHFFELAGLLLLVAGFVGYAAILGLGVVQSLQAQASMLVLSSLALIGGHLALFFSWVADQEPSSGRHRQPILPMLVRLEPSLAMGLGLLGMGTVALLAPLVFDTLFASDPQSAMVGWLMPAGTLAFLGMQSLLFAVMAHTISTRRT